MQYKNTLKIDNYEKQAQYFLDKTGARISVKYLGFGPYFLGETEKRCIFRFTIQRGKKSYTAKYGQSIANYDKTPTAYDILACMTKYDPGSFENFCGDYGYDTDSRNAERIYKSVCKEYAGMNRLFSSEELEEMSEIA